MAHSTAVRSHDNNGCGPKSRHNVSHVTFMRARRQEVNIWHFSQAAVRATRCAMMKRALKVPHGVVVDRCQHIPPRLHHHATRRAVGHAAERTHGPGGPILLTDHCRCRFCWRCLPTLHVQRMSGRTAPPSALSGKSRTWNGRRAPASALAGEAVSANGMHWCGARRRQWR